MAIKLRTQTQEEEKLKESAKLGKFWLYDSVKDEFFLELTSNEIAEKLGISQTHVSNLVYNNGYYQQRWIVFDGTFGTPAKFLSHFSLPSRIIIDAKIPLSKMWGEKIYGAYYKKYRSHRQIIQLNERGQEIASYKTWKECAEALNTTWTKVQATVVNAKNLKRTIPNICFREDYAEVYNKYYKAKWGALNDFTKKKSLNENIGQTQQTSPKWSSN